jgi:hypothetical protein
MEDQNLMFIDLVLENCAVTRDLQLIKILLSKYYLYTTKYVLLDKFREFFGQCPDFFNTVLMLWITDLKQLDFVDDYHFVTHIKRFLSTNSGFGNEEIEKLLSSCFTALDFKEYVNSLSSVPDVQENKVVSSVSDISSATQNLLSVFVTSNDEKTINKKKVIQRIKREIREEKAQLAKHESIIKSMKAKANEFSRTEYEYPISILSCFNIFKTFMFRKQKRDLFFTYNEEEIAYHLTYLEFEMLNDLKLRDFYDHIHKNNSHSRGPTVLEKSVERFNFICNWTSTVILSQSTPKRRASVIAKFVRILRELRNLKNYNSMLGIMSGIQASPVQRLRKTLAIFQKMKSYQDFTSMVILLSSSRSFANYRFEIKTTIENSTNIIPYVGLYLKDLLYIEQANPDIKQNALNEKKLNMLKNILNSIELGKSNTNIYTFNVWNYQLMDSSVSFIFDKPILMDDQLYERSLFLEPKLTE